MEHCQQIHSSHFVLRYSEWGLDLEVLLTSSGRLAFHSSSGKSSDNSMKLPSLIHLTCLAGMGALGSQPWHLSLVTGSAEP